MINNAQYSRCVLKETVNGINQVNLGDELLDKRNIYFNTSVESATAESLFQQLLYLEQKSPGEPINLFINSPGGNVADGMIIYDLIRMMKSPVTSICTGRACSMGAIIFLAADKRLILPHSEIMIHDASFGSADFGGFKPDEIEEKTKGLVDTCKMLRTLVSERTNQPIKKVVEKMKKDSYFKANEAIEFGLATEIINDVTSLYLKGGR